MVSVRVRGVDYGFKLLLRALDSILLLLQLRRENACASEIHVGKP